MNSNNFIKENREYLVKQSEMLQAIINRMAGNSLAIKQLGITIWTTLMGFGFTNKTKSLFVLAIISFALLGFLDSYYLYLERRFRLNFNQLSILLCGFSDDEMKVVQHFKGNFLALECLDKNKLMRLYLDSLRAWSNLPYLTVMVITIIVFFVN